MAHSMIALFPTLWPAGHCRLGSRHSWHVVSILPSKQATCPRFCCHIVFIIAYNRCSASKLLLNKASHTLLHPVRFWKLPCAWVMCTVTRVFNRASSLAGMSGKP